MRVDCHRFVQLTLVAMLSLCPFVEAKDSVSNIGPNWEEGVGKGGGDAGDTRQTAAEVKAEGSSEVQTISGRTKGETEGFLPGSEEDWQDVFAIFITNPGAFVASTAVAHGGAAEFDTMLWLFSYRGTGLLGNNDTDNGALGSTLLAQSTDGVINLANIGQGIYYLAVSGVDSMPQTVNGGAMFPFPGQDGIVVSPTPEGFADELGSWFPEATPEAHGDYTIRFAPNVVQFIPQACGEDESGSCFEASDTPGCDRLQCCTLVCYHDPFCCDVNWDQQCANQAIENCVSCGNPNTDSCAVVHETPFCNDADCCEAVCDIDNFCCSTAWDATCVAHAQQVCGLPCDGQCPGDFNDDGEVSGGDLGIMLARWNSVGCADLNGDGTVNGGDLGLLLAIFGSCNECGRAGNPDCFSASEYVGCEDAACCELVCAANEACCDTMWDGACAGLAMQLCQSCSNPTNGSCFEKHASPNCNDPACCSLVCAVDPACCQAAWDQACISHAFKLCGTSCGHPNNGPCDLAHGTPGCSNEECCRAVCELLPRCCEIMWDTDCVETANVFGECGG